MAADSPLLEHHRRFLRDRAVADDVADERGYQSVARDFDAVAYTIIRPHLDGLDRALRQAAADALKPEPQGARRGREQRCKANTGGRSTASAKAWRRTNVEKWITDRLDARSRSARRCS